MLITNLWAQMLKARSNVKQVHPSSSIIYKGFRPEIDSYSAFFDNKKLNHTDLEEVLRKMNITDVYICGIALDVCVGESR